MLVQVTIPNGTSTSNGLLLAGAKAVNGTTVPNNARPIGISVGAWTAADVSFEVSLDGTTWRTLRDGLGEVYKIAQTANSSHPLNIDAFRGFPLIRLRSGVPDAFVNQGAERVITLSLGV